MMPGMIMLWYGSISTIPSGWHLCDGTMGTPDLRIKFVAGAFSDSHPTFGPGKTGGASGHDHTFLGDGHSHYLQAGDNIIDSYPAGDMSVGVTNTPATGTISYVPLYPPYHALCYIMKL